MSLRGYALCFSLLVIAAFAERVVVEQEDVTKSLPRHWKKISDADNLLRKRMFNQIEVDAVLLVNQVISGNRITDRTPVNISL
jgi:hypothetical protein